MKVSHKVNLILVASVQLLDLIVTATEVVLFYLFVKVFKVNRFFLIFLTAFLTAPRSTLGHSLGDSLTNTILYNYFDPRVTRRS